MKGNKHFMMKKNLFSFFAFSLLGFLALAVMLSDSSHTTHAQVSTSENASIGIFGGDHSRVSPAIPAGTVEIYITKSDDDNIINRVYAPSIFNGIYTINNQTGAGANPPADVSGGFLDGTGVLINSAASGVTVGQQASVTFTFKDDTTGNGGATLGSYVLNYTVVSSQITAVTPQSSTTVAPGDTIDFVVNADSYYLVNSYTEAVLTGTTSGSLSVVSGDYRFPGGYSDTGPDRLIAYWTDPDQFEDYSLTLRLNTTGMPLGTYSLSFNRYVDNELVTSPSAISITITNTPPVCGDGNVDAGEACDDAGESATCNANCTAVACGDSIVNASAGETCDDGNTTDGDGCSSSCQTEGSSAGRRRWSSFFPSLLPEEVPLGYVAPLSEEHGSALLTDPQKDQFLALLDATIENIERERAKILPLENSTFIRAPLKPIENHMVIDKGETLITINAQDYLMTSSLKGALSELYALPDDAQMISSEKEDIVRLVINEYFVDEASFYDLGDYSPEPETVSISLYDEALQIEKYPLNAYYGDLMISDPARQSELVALGYEYFEAMDAQLDDIAQYMIKKDLEEDFVQEVFNTLVNHEDDQTKIQTYAEYFAEEEIAVEAFHDLLVYDASKDDLSVEMTGLIELSSSVGTKLGKYSQNSVAQERDALYELTGIDPCIPCKEYFTKLYKGHVEYDRYYTVYQEQGCLSADDIRAMNALQRTFHINVRKYSECRLTLSNPELCQEVPELQEGDSFELCPEGNKSVLPVESILKEVRSSLVLD